MKAVDAIKHHEAHKYTISGIVVGSALLLLGLASQRMMMEPRFHPMEVYMILIPGAAILLRSLRPPIGFVRGITALAGGVLLGTVPMLFTAPSATLNWLSIAIGLVGAALLGTSFTVRPEKETHEAV